MREVVAVCRSEGKARRRAALVLDRYLWRVGDRTWRGMASNQCLARISGDLRKSASKKIAVAIHGFASTDDKILFRVGSRSRFDASGRSPVSTGKPGRSQKSDQSTTTRAVLRIAALFHDMGKASRIFQEKLARVLEGGGPEADPIRHELISAFVWDELTDDVASSDLKDCLRNLKPGDIDFAFQIAIKKCGQLHGAGNSPRLELKFQLRNDVIGYIGLMILCHHRLSSASKTGKAIEAAAYIREGEKLDGEMLRAADGLPFWHSDWFRQALAREAEQIAAPVSIATLDTHARTTLMLADHFGSSEKRAGDGVGHLANTLRTADGELIAADNLEQHTKRVYDAVRGAYDAIFAARNDYPGLTADMLPDSILNPNPDGPARFAWQARAAEMTRISVREGGGFFAAVLAGTGTGKTRAAPVIMAAAAMGDPSPQRQKLRYTLGLGLRTLATQSGREYVADLGFSRKDVSVMVGSPPLEFKPDDSSGSENMLTGLNGISIENSEDVIPDDESALSADWLKGLTYDPDRQLPQFIEAKCRSDGQSGSKMRKLCETPILCATIDHIISAASPARSFHLAAALRVMTSDLVIDEVDQFSAEDCAVVARLVNLAGASGRRVILLSATMSQPLVETMSRAYAIGWASYAAQFGAPESVTYLVTSDAQDDRACQLTRDYSEVPGIMRDVRSVSATEGSQRQALRRVEVFPCDLKEEIPSAVSAVISEMHNRHAIELGEFRVSFGFVRMTRISHTVALAASLPPARDRLRLAICLHSRMKRVTRAWIERELKAALTRKGGNPNAGIDRLCREQDVYSRARALGVQDIELVLVCSPVIETGNDLDFDYAIIDPQSMRAIVQSAGRVNRHRLLGPSYPNIALFPTPVQVLDGGRLSMPGVETRLPTECFIDPVNLGQDRSTPHLIGNVDLERLDAAWMRPDIAPLAAAEEKLVTDFLTRGPRSVIDWATSPMLRNTTSIMTARKFRRTTVRNLTLFQMPSGYREISWFRDDGIGDLEPEQITILPGPGLASPLFRDIDRQSMSALYGDEAVGRYRMRRATEVDWPVYGEEGQIDAIYSGDYGLIREADLAKFKGE